MKINYNNNFTMGIGDWGLGIGDWGLGIGTKSTYMNDYMTFGDIHCGMTKQPLIPYNMDSSRTRLPINGIISGAAINRASIELGVD